MKKRQRKIRLIRAGIQLLFFIFAPALFSTAFAGVKSVFQAIAAHQAISWNSFLDVTAVLLVVTCLFGRHFCGYACAFGSLGDALYELTVFIRQKVFHKKGRHGYSEKAIRILQKVKYIWLLVLLVSILTGWYSKLQGMSPWDVFSMLTAGRLPGAAYKVGIVLLILLMIGMCTQERFFCQFLCPMGAIFAIMPIAPSALFNRDSGTCPAKCGACKKRCPAHLDIDGDTPLSGECICCHACQGICPKRNIRIGIPKAKDESLFYAIGHSVGIPYSIKSPAGQDRTAAERNYVTEATRCRWETLLCNRGNKKNMKSVFEVQGNCLTVHLPEEVDHPVSEDIRKESDNIMRKKYIRTMIFDFSETMFMDSSGIGLIMGRYRAMGMRGDCIRATGVSAYIEKLLHLSGVYKFVEICREV